MKAIDTRGNLKNILDNKSLSIPTDQLRTICNIQDGAKACRYIVLGVNGFICVKHTKMKQVLDNMVDEGKMMSKGDNCSGICQGILSNANKKENKEKSDKKDSEEISKEDDEKISEEENDQKGSKEEGEERQKGKETPYKIKVFRPDIQSG